MKNSEITEQTFRSEKDEYIRSRWRGLQEVVGTTLTRIINYLFVLNSGGLLAALTYIAAKQKTEQIYAAICCFVVGIVFITSHAALDYYACDRQFRSFRSDIDSFVKNEIDWEVLVDRDDRRGTSEWLFHILGWLSGVAFLIGLYLGIRGI
jgi:hypothetical protein